MTETTIPLSVGNIRHLIRGLKQLSTELGRNGAVTRNVEKAYGELLADDVAERIASIPRGSSPAGIDGNVSGVEPPNVRVQPTLNASSTEVVWTGEQIKFVEFGTGAAGASGAYPLAGVMSAANYHPDPTKDFWWYPYNGYAIKSRGIPPYAPMGTAALMAPVMNYTRHPSVTLPIKEAVQRAISL